MMYMQYADTIRNDDSATLSVRIGRSFISCFRAKVVV